MSKKNETPYKDDEKDSKIIIQRITINKIKINDIKIKNKILKEILTASMENT